MSGPPAATGPLVSTLRREQRRNWLDPAVLIRRDRTLSRLSHFFRSLILFFAEFKNGLCVCKIDGLDN